MSDTPYAVETTRTSLDIFEALVDSDEPVGVTFLADELGLSKSVVHNHLSTLCARQYVQRTGSLYEPTLWPLALGSQIRDGIDVYRAGREKIDNLAEATGETTTMFVEEAGMGVPVYISNPSSGWTPKYTEGERMPLHVNAPGKAILSTYDTADLPSVLDLDNLVARTAATIIDPEELVSMLNKIRTDGVAFCRGEQFEGVVGLAAPIPSYNGSRRAAIGVCGPTKRLSGRYLEEDILGQVISTSKSIQVELTSD